MATAKEKSEIIDEPLDTLEIHIIKNGVQSRVPALNIGFMENRNYVHFTNPPTSSNDTGQASLLAEEEEWLENSLFLKEDLQWVLKLPYHRFWSQVIYDENLHKCLESYLTRAPRDYDLVDLHLKEEIVRSLKKVHKLVFLVYLRMSTYKESKKHHIRPEAFGTIIYDNFIFDVPKIMDLCALYGMQNLAIVSKMVQNIFSTQFKYNEDLNKTSQVVLEAFSSVEETLSMNLQDMQSISSTCQINGVNTRKEFSISSFHDLINYITDVSATLHSFLEVYSPGCQMFYQNGAAVRIATFYENAFPAIEREVSRRSKENENERLIEDIKRKVCLSKTLLIKNFRSIINYCCIQNIINSKLSEGRHSSLPENPYAEQFLDIFTEIVSEKNFLHDYNLLYPFETDLELFNEVGLTLDPQRLNYIFSSIHDSVETIPESLKSSIVNGARPKIKKRESSQASSKTLQNAVDILRGEDFHSRGPGDSPNDHQLSSLIQNVLDVFPDLGGGFIEKCLEHLHYDHERVIDALITDSLPDHLSALDRNLKRSVELDEGCNSNYSVLSERKNIFDNDEFDIFARKDVDMEKIHIGKKDKTPLTYETLTKDPESEFLKQLTLTYGAEETESTKEENLYEDDYDDTYDSAMVGLKEPVPEGVPDVDDQQNEEPSESTRDTSKDFCENPEIIREKRQQRWEEKKASRGSYRGGAGPPSSDHSRQNKDRNKSNVGNHNRRKQSDFKRSRGMIPS